MKELALAVFLCLSFSAGAAGALPVQFPGQGFPDRFPSTDPLLEVERQQLTSETLLILRDMVAVMRQSSDLPPADRERLEDLSRRLDFLITRQQDLAMRSRLGR